MNQYTQVTTGLLLAASQIRGFIAPTCRMTGGRQPMRASEEDSVQILQAGGPSGTGRIHTRDRGRIVGQRRWGLGLVDQWMWSLYAGGQQKE